MSFEHADGGKLYLMGVFSDDYGVIVHDAVHVTQFLMRDVGSDDDETQAYMVEAIFDFAMKHLPKETQIVE